MALVIPGTALKRFQKFIRIEGEHWIWIGAVSGSGDGSFGWGIPKLVTARQASYMLYIGEIPDGMAVRKSCDVHLCVAPSCLYLVTYRRAPRGSSVVERFQTLYTEISGHCMWDGSIQPETGYGTFSFEGRTQSAHRVSYKLFIGPIPTGLFVLHRCDIHACVNPVCLWAGTRRDNTEDMIAKGRQARGVRVHGARLSDEKVRIIRDIYDGEFYTQDRLALMFEVSRSTVGMVLSGKTWR